jgi:uncharacterized RDD family membrane protein YckC
MKEKPYQGYTLGSRGSRFLVAIINAILVGIVTNGITQALGTSVNPMDAFDFRKLDEIQEIAKDPTNILINAVIAVVLHALYGYLCYPKLKGTVGHKALKLRVINADKTTLDAKQGAIRELLKAGPGVLSNIALIAGQGLQGLIGLGALIYAIWLLWDEDKQNLYDKIAKTYVVEDKDPVIPQESTEQTPTADTI